MAALAYNGRGENEGEKGKGKEASRPMGRD
jgi:hypothetical protein